MQKDRHVYLTLDGLRGFAALSVMVMHIGPDQLGFALPNAYLAVDFFFALSGFVIAHAYGHKLDTGLSVRAFMIERYIRLYPMYMLGTVIGFAYAVLVVAVGISSQPESALFVALIPAALMLPSPLPGVSGNYPLDLRAMFPLNAVAWSLLAELIVNLVAAGLWRHLSRYVLLGFMIVGGAALILSAVALGNAAAGAFWDDWYVAAARVTFSFFLGVLIHRHRAGLRLRSRIRPLWLVLALMLIFAAPIPAKGQMIFDLAMIFFLLPAILIAGANIEPGPRAAPIFRIGGNLSYPIYALHAPMLDLGRAVERKIPTLIQFGTAWFWFGFAAIIVMASSLALKYFDTPVRRRLKTLASARPLTASPVPR